MTSPVPAELAAATGTAIYAWALLPNHAHLLLRSGAGASGSVTRRPSFGASVGRPGSGWRSSGWAAGGAPSRPCAHAWSSTS